jgi:serine/threonine protein kinase
MTIPFDLLHDILVPRSGKLFALKKSIHRFRGRRDRNLFIREINCVAELKPHKNIVRYDRYFDHDILFTFPASSSIFFFRAWQDAGHYFIVMELCTGGTLRGLIVKEGFISLNRIRMLMHGFLSGLELLDMHNLIHLDLKPDNLFLSEDGGLKIGDFGLCHSASEWDSDEGDGAYIAPEVLNEKATSAADIFSAGLILFQMLVGIQNLPRQGSEWRRLRSGEDLFADIPPGRETDSNMRNFWKDLTDLSSSMVAVSCSDRPHARDCLMSKCFSCLSSQESARP